MTSGEFLMARFYTRQQPPEEIEQVWINLLRLGMLDDLLSLIGRA